jgi:uncharacterized protein
MINLSGSYIFEVPREQVWPRIFDPISLMCLIPGCEEIVQTAPGEYKGRLRVGMAAIRGTYQSIVKVVKEVPPELCIFDGELSGPTGIVQGQAIFTLFDLGETSRIQYEGKGIITGALAFINHRFIEGAAESLIKMGLVCLNKQLKDQPDSNDE